MRIIASRDAKSCSLVQDLASKQRKILLGLPERFGFTRGKL